MRLLDVLLPLAFIAQAAAQSNPLESLVSEVYSVYTQVTSILASDASAASAVTTASTSASTSPSTTATTSPSTTASTTLGTSTRSSAIPTPTSVTQSQASKTAAAVAASSTSKPSSGGGTNHRLLAIILGAVLGALVLGLLVLVLLLCCRRRRRRDSTPRRAVSPQDDEVDSWRLGRSQESHSLRPESRGNSVGQNHANYPVIGAAAMPQMVERPSYNNDNRENPFVPAPPPPRRTAPNSRAGLTDGTVPGEAPYVVDPLTGGPRKSLDVRKDSQGHLKGSTVAAALGGAAIGAAALHHHNEKDAIRHSHDADRLRGDSLSRTSRERQRSSDRKAAGDSSLSPVSPIGKDSYPSPSATAYDHSHPEFASRNGISNDPPGYGAPYESMPRDTTQPRTSALLSASSTLGQSRIPNIEGRDAKAQYPSNYALVTGGAVLGAGAVGAAAANKHDRKKSKSRSPHRKRRSLSIHKAVTEKRDSQSLSDYTSSSTNSGGGVHRDSNSGASYDERLPTFAPQPHSQEIRSEFPSDVPPTPPLRSRRNSALGTAAPPAALGSHHEPDLLDRELGLDRDRAGDRDTPPVPPVPFSVFAQQNQQRNRRRSQTPPSVPSRSPKRTRFSDLPFDLPGSPSPPTPDTDIEQKGIVGDHRYPHMGLPSRRSGDGFDRTVPTAQPQPGTALEHSSSDDSTWRLSSGMPGGWTKDPNRTSSLETSRNSGLYGRDSGVSGMGSTSHFGSHSRTGSMTSTSGNGNGRRLRLADLRREEEEREMQRRGRKSMEGEWAGNGGYDGYDYHHGGVGQAL